MYARRIAYVLLGGLILSAAIILFEVQNKNQKNLNFFWMPYCPYGQDAARVVLSLCTDENSFKKIQFYYIAREFSDSIPLPSTVIKDQPKDSTGCSSMGLALKPDFERFASLHGAKETEEGIRQVVIQKKWPEKFRTYLALFLKNPNLPWQTRAEKADLPVKDLETTTLSPQAADWFSANIYEAAERGIDVSPRVVIGGGRPQTLPQAPEGIRYMLCSLSVISGTSCQGITCQEGQECPVKFGYIATCQNGFCTYTPEPLQPDAVDAYLIVPQNCLACKGFPVVQELKGWSSHLNVTHLALSDEKAQELLRGVEVQSFPVLAISSEIGKRTWGQECLNELGMTNNETKDGWHYLALDRPQYPFSIYGHIWEKDNTIRVSIDPMISAGILLKEGDSELAANAYRQVLALDPNAYPAWNNLGTILYDDLNLRSAAGAMFETACHLNHAYQPALKNAIRYLIDAGEPDRAIPYKADLAWSLVMAGNYEMAGAIFNEIGTNPQYAFNAHKGLGYILVKLGSLQPALEQLTTCVKIDPQPDSDFCNLLAGVYYRLGKNPEARTWYEKAVNNPKPVAEAYSNLCTLLETEGAWSELLENATKGQATLPNNHEFAFFQAEALEKLGHPQEAIPVLEKLKGLDAASQFRADYELAVLSADSGHLSDAQGFAHDYLGVIKSNPDSKFLDQTRRIAQLVTEAQDYSLAKEAWQTVVRMKPSDTEAHLRLADCYQQLGKPAERKEELTLARQFGADVPEEN